MKKHILTLLFLWAVMTSQADAIYTMVGQNSMVIPFLSSYQFNQAKPDITLGYEHSYLSNNWFSLNQSAELSYAYQSDFQQSLIFQTKIIPRFHYLKCVYSDLSLGIGGGAILRTNQFTLDKGEIVREPVSPLSTICLSLGLEQGMEINSQLSLALRGEAQIYYYGYHDMDYLIPFLPYGKITVGLKYQLN